MTTTRGEAFKLKRSRACDLIRVVAIIAVICCHVNKGSASSDILAIIDAFASLGVPLFIMLTGYLMLDRDFSHEAYLRRYLGRNLLPLFVAFELWNLIWWLLGHVIPMSDWRDLGGTIKVALFAGETGSALWYMQMAIGVYLGMPILWHALQWLRDPSRLTYRVVLAVVLAWFGFGIPTVQQLVRALDIPLVVSPILDMNIFGASVWGGSVWMIYLIVGLAARKGAFDHIRSRSLLLLLPISLIGCAAIEFLSRQNGSHSMAYGSVLVACPAISLFILVMRTESMLQRLADASSMMLQEASEWSFSIYMIHIWVGNAIWPILSQVPLRPLALLAVNVVVVSVLSYGVARIIGLVPMARRWLLLMK